jgi:hypothetical protein
MAAAEEGAVSATLPRPKRTTTAIEYYVEVTAADFQTQRTPEITLRVVRGDRECASGVVARAASTATVLIEVLSGGPPVPVGFSGAGVVSGATGVAVGGTGGLSINPAVAVAAGTGLAAGAIVVATTRGDEATCPATNGAFHEISLDCAGIENSAKVGCPIGFQVGVGRWSTVLELQQALAGHRGVITVDGRELSVTNEGPTMHAGGGEAPGFGDRARATWTATRGMHSVVGYWTIHPDVVSRCEFSVSD